MSRGQIVLGILLFAAATSVLYVWGLRKSMNQGRDLSRQLLHRCGSKVIRYLKKHDTITKKETARLIGGVTAKQFWSRGRLVVAEPDRFAGEVLEFLLDQQYIQPVGNGRYRLK